jgi:hypothetical protein
MALTVDYVRAENRDQIMRRNLNPPTRVSTGRTAPVVRPNPEFVQNVWEPINVGEYDYDALQLQFNKRFGAGYSYRVSYTLARTHGNTGNDVAEIIPTQVGDDLHLELNEGPTDDDRPHILSISGIFNVPGVPGLSVSPLIRYMSGTPFTLTNSTFDQNRNGRVDDEFLAPGSYSGTGQNGITVGNDGGPNGARGPDFFSLDLRLTYGVQINGSPRFQLFGEIYNLSDRANFNNPAGDQRLSNFLSLTSLVPGNTSRRAQIGARFSF